MKALSGIFLLTFMISVAGTVESNDEQVSAIVQKINARLRENVSALEVYGYYQDVVTKHLQNSGALKKEEKRTYRTVWIEGKPFHELVQCGGRQLTRAELSKEQKRRAEFIKAVPAGGRSTGALQELKTIRWWELYQKYDFALLPAEAGAAYVLSFKPKRGKLSERSRFEKVLNHLAGKIWVDERYNVLKAQANLLCPVKFGWGLIGKVLKSQIEYSQREHGNVWLPSHVSVAFKMQAALFHTENRNINVRWYEPYTRDTSLAHTAVQRAKTGFN